MPNSPSSAAADVYGRDGPLLKYDCRDAGTQARILGIAYMQADNVGDRIACTRLHRFTSHPGDRDRRDVSMSSD
jgi:hypothetical protein